MAERTPDSKLTPGALLQRSRQRYGWSIEDVAEELNLLPYVVEAIEQDDYSQMSGWTYAVGYLRGYAKLVGIGIDEAILTHKSLLPEKEDGPGTLTHRTGAKVSIPISLSWVVTLVVVIIVAGGLGVTYWKRASEKEKVVLEGQIAVNQTDAVLEGEPTVEESRDVDMSGVEDISEIIGKDGEASEASPRDEESTKVEGSGKTAQSSMAAPTDTDIETRTGLLLTLASIDTRIVGSSLVDTSDASTDKLIGKSDGAPAVNFVPDRSDRNNPRVFELFFDQGSWVDVRDANGGELLRESIQAGSSVRLEGQPPFTIFLGNATGVRYLYLGKEHIAPISGDSLFGRFQLGGTN